MAAMPRPTPLIEASADGRPFKAAENNRFTSHLPSICRPTVEELQSGTLERLRVRSRYIFRNHAHAAGAIKLIIRRVVGAGMRIQARQRDQAGRFAVDENKALEQIWRDWARIGLSVRGHREQAFWRTVMWHRLVDGEVFLVKTTDRAGLPVTRRWQILRGDQLAENTWTKPRGVAKKNQVVLGVELQASGKPVAYHFYRDGDTSYGANQNAKTIRIDAKRVFHWFAPEIADNPRGIPLLAPVVLPLADVDEYAAAMLTQAWSQTNTVAFIKTMLAEERQDALVGSDYKDSSMTTEEKPARWRERMVPGVKEYLLPDEDVVFADPKSPNAQFDPFTRSILRAVAAGIGLSYEALARDYTQTNYSSGRQTALEDRMAYREFALEMDEQATSPVWRDFIDHVYYINQLRAKPDVEDIYSHWIQHPQPGWVDPEKEQNAWAKAIENRIGSRTEACAERGRDFRDVADELAEEDAYLKEKGIKQESPEAKEFTDRTLAKILPVGNDKDEEDAK